MADRRMVQGVGFRFFVQHRATALGLSGWARNLADGRVEVYAAGEAERLSDLAAALHSGPRMARVRTVEEQDAAVKKSQASRFAETSAVLNPESPLIASVTT